MWGEQLAGNKGRFGEGRFVAVAAAVAYAIVAVAVAVTVAVAVAARFVAIRREGLKPSLTAARVCRGCGSAICGGGCGRGRRQMAAICSRKFAVPPPNRLLPP